MVACSCRIDQFLIELFELFELYTENIDFLNAITLNIVSMNGLQFSFPLHNLTN